MAISSRTGATDADLARGCRQGDPAAWRAVVERFTPQVYRLAFRMLGSDAEAKDACQEALVRMHRSFDTFDATRALAPWVSRVAYHVCLRRLEGSARQQSGRAAEGELEAVPASGRDPEGQVAAGEEDALVERFLGELPPRDRALLLLRYRDGLSDAEVAEATGLPVGTVKTRIFRARASLRARLAPLTREEP